MRKADRFCSLSAFCVVLYCHRHYVLHPLTMPHRSPALPLKPRTSYGAHLLDHLAADGAGLTGGQVAVVAVLQIHADLPRCIFYLLNLIFHHVEIKYYLYHLRFFHLSYMIGSK